MNSKPSYEQLEQRVKALTQETLDSKRQLEVLQNRLTGLENETDPASWGTDNIRISGINTDMAGVLQKMNQEITVRRETEEKLAESEKRLDSIISSVPDIIYRLDPQGRITFISQPVTEYGYATGDLIGQSIYDIVHPEDRDSVRTRIDERRTGNRRTRNLEVRLMNKLFDDAAPNKTNSGYSVFLLGAEGLYEASDHQGRHFIGTQGIVRDITERKQLESQLQEAQKMEAIGTLAGGIAHDFNNILGTIIGYAEMIEMFDVPENDKVRDRLKYILASAYRAKDLVQQILTFSRRTEQDKVPVALTPILKDIIKFLRASLPATIKINAQYDADNSSVLGDSTQLYQVIMNLCTNAAHAMGKKGGILEVNLSDVHSDSIDSGQQAELEPGSYIMVGVQDTGDGMTPDMLDRIFEPFFTTKRRGEGTGLGLSVVHGIVKGMRGTISVHTQKGEGSLFKVYIPRYEGWKDQPLSEKLPRIVRGKGRILFIDDEQSLVDFAREVLTGLGYEVVALTSSPEALKQFSQQPNTFDLVIADLTMPDLTGLELAEAIMGLRPDIPVILCTGFADPANAEKARKMGIAEVIKKPFGIQEFGETIRRALDK
jgi:PAS domain S-box-containing protein